jgi:hypothetical protein
MNNSEEYMMEIKNMSVEQLREEILNAVKAYNEQYLIKHPTDWDCCGFAWISFYLGRRTKIVNFLNSIGLFSVDKTTRYGKVVYSANLNGLVPKVGHQSLTYKEDMYRAIMPILKQRPELEGIEFFVDSMMD